MGLNKQKLSPYGFNWTLASITGVTLNANADPIIAVRWSLGSNLGTTVSENITWIKGPKVGVVATVNITEAAYTYLLTLPEFAGATRA